MNDRVLSLCIEYTNLVDSMRHGRYDADELRSLDSDRLVLHEQLMEMTGLDRTTDMYRFARDEMHKARSQGYLRED